MTRYRGSILFVILLVAALARLGFSAWVVGFDAITIGDEGDYQLLAENIVAGKGFVAERDHPTGRRPPGYPFFLSLIYRATGTDRVAGRIAQIVLGVIVVWLTYAIGRRHFGDAAGLLAAAIAALNPFLTFISGYVLTENLYMVLLLGAIATMPPPTAPAPARRWIAGCALLAAASLTRPSGLPMAIWVGAVAVLLSQRPWAERVNRVAVLIIVLAACLLPWSIRNERTFGSWVGLTTHGGITFYQGNNARVVDIEHYRGGVAPLGMLPDFDRLSTMNEAERNHAAYGLGREFLADNPELIPKLTWWKFKRLWRMQSDMGMSGIRSGWWFGKDSALGSLAARFDAGFAYAAFVFPLFLAGLVVTRRRWRDLSYLYGVIAVHTAIGLVFFGSLRGRLPIEPVVAVFAGAAVVAIIEALRRPRDRDSAPDPQET